MLFDELFALVILLNKQHILESLRVIVPLLSELVDLKLHPSIFLIQVIDKVGVRIASGFPVDDILLNQG
jgi:hypothetical protein